MFFHFLYGLSDQIAAFNVCKYITFRAVVAFLVATTVAIFWGQTFIRFMKQKQFGQVVRDDGPASHFKKAGTPTMGGLIIIIAIAAGLLLGGNFHSKPLLIVLLSGFSYFALGFLDDYLKVLKKNTKGVTAKQKMLWQCLTGFLVVYLAVNLGVIDTKIYMPFFKNEVIDLGPLYYIFGMFVIVGSSNAVNLTDGLDGLAIGPIMTSAFTLGLLSYVAGHRELATYLYIPYVENAGEMFVLASAMIGAGIGFLWYNSHPAQVFMGDVGSLSLGGILGTIAVLSKNEILFVFIGGVFVIEALSVIIQVVSYKLRRKRVFKMAPIHHHFELLGWPEPKVIVRFWIISILLAIMAIATLKTR